MDFTFAEQEAVSCTVSCKDGRMQGANPCPQYNLNLSPYQPRMAERK